MNKAYKVIWSKVKGCYVVVSELAKERGKNNSRGKHALLAGIVMATLLGSALFPADMVYAADGAAHYVNVAVNTGKTIEARKYPGETIEESAIDPDVNYDLSAHHQRHQYWRGNKRRGEWRCRYGIQDHSKRRICDRSRNRFGSVFKRGSRSRLESVYRLEPTE